MSSHHLEPEHLPDIAPSNHGKTVAGWATMAGIMVGVTISGVGMMIPNGPLIWVGLGVALAGLVAGAILRALGYGQPLK